MGVERRNLKKFFAVIGLLSFTVLFFSPGKALADSQIHFLGGATTAIYNGPISGSFTVPTTFDGEYEWFVKNQTSFFTRLTFANDLILGVPYYTYIGGGMNFYFKSKGMINEVSDLGVVVLSKPIWRHYFGWDIGLSQVIVRSLGKVLQVISDLSEIGARVGTIYQLDRHFGFEAQLGGSIGYGFTSVAVTGTTGHFYLGVVYYF